MYDCNLSNFIQSVSYWGILQDHMHKTTLQIIESLCNLKDVGIEWPNKDAKRKKSIENVIGEGFLGCVRKVDGTNIILKNKPGVFYNKKIFFIQKKIRFRFICFL